MKTCHNCGFEMADNMNFCPQCHAKYEAPEPSASAPAAAERTVKASAASAGKNGDLKKLLVSILVLLLVLAGTFGTKFATRRVRISALEEALIKDCHFKKGAFEVRHLDGSRYGVFLIWSYKGKKVDSKNETPAFVMVFDDESRTFKFASESDEASARGCRILMDGGKEPPVQDLNLNEDDFVSN